MGGVYVLRDSSRGQTSVLEISVNGLPIAKTAPKTFTQVNLKKGRYYIGGRGENYTQIELNIDSGKKYFIRQVVTTGWNDFRNEFQIMELGEVENSIADLRLVRKIARDSDLKPMPE